MNWDQKMATPNAPAQCKNSNLNEELGVVSEIIIIQIIINIGIDINISLSVAIRID